MIRSAIILLTFSLSFIELLPLCVAVKMEDFKASFQGSKCWRIDSSYCYVRMGLHAPGISMAYVAHSRWGLLNMRVHAHCRNARMQPSAIVSWGVWTRDI